MIKDSREKLISYNLNTVQMLYLSRHVTFRKKESLWKDAKPWQRLVISECSFCILS